MFQKCHFLGSSSFTVENGYGLKIDLSWFTIVSSIISVIGVLFGARWTVNPIGKETNGVVAFLIFLPMFFFRMLAWLTIITILHSFSFFVLAGFATLNVVVTKLAQGPVDARPVLHTFTSLAFPVVQFPSSTLDDSVSLKLLFWTSVVGNFYLIAILGELFVLYSFDVYNPWCLKSESRLIVPEVLMNNIHFPIIALFASATIPIVIIFTLKCYRLASTSSYLLK
jgi:hypothetical protein